MSDLRKLVKEFRAIADDFNVTKGDSRIEAAYLYCADELEAALHPSGQGAPAQQADMRFSSAAKTSLFQVSICARNTFIKRQPT